jgi:ABC-type multidrug transport system fused ATPase/permease subunit
MVIMFVFMRLFPRVVQITQSYYQVLIYRPSYELVMQITNTSKARRERAFSLGKNYNSFSDCIEFRNVSFSYNQHSQIIKDLNFKLRKGKTVAIVGGSGSGKTTITDLVLGLLEPDNGAIYIDNQPLTDVNLISYRKKIGYIGQETILVNDTIKQNIIWGLDQSLSDEKIESIAKLCHVHEFVNALPEKYNTIIGDKGMMVSGGQRQRLAIARAIARDPELLILDEATSALDSETEKIIQQAIENLSDEVTILIIAHRLSTIVNADEIVVLENGSILEKGSFKELMNNDGRFKYMYDLQQQAIE